MKKVYDLVPALMHIDQISIFPYQHGTASALALLSKGKAQANLSCNIKERSHILGPMEFFIRTWDRYAPLFRAAVDRGMLIPTGQREPHGKVFAEICRLDLLKVNPRFTCPLCRTIWPSAQGAIWDETQLPYCKACLAVLQDEGDLAVDDASFDLDGLEKKLRFPKQPE